MNRYRFATIVSVLVLIGLVVLSFTSKYPTKANCVSPFMAVIPNISPYSDNSSVAPTGCIQLENGYTFLLGKAEGFNVGMIIDSLNGQKSNILVSHSPLIMVKKSKGIIVNEALDQATISHYYIFDENGEYKETSDESLLEN